MLVCNVSLRPSRIGISANLAEVASATDATATGNIVFATLVDDPASVRDLVDAYSGEIMLEAASADTAVDAGFAYSVDIIETVTAQDSASATVSAVGVWTITFSGTLNTGSAGWLNYNIRQMIASSQLSTNGSSVRVTLEAAAAASAVIGSVYIGHAAASGDPYDFNGNQVQLKVGGSGSFSITGGTPVVTDAATFAFDHTKNVIIAAFFNGTSSIGANNSFGLGNATQYYKSTANETSVSDVNSYANSAGTLSLVSKIEVQ